MIERHSHVALLYGGGSAQGLGHLGLVVLRDGEADRALDGRPQFVVQIEAPDGAVDGPLLPLHRLISERACVTMIGLQGKAPSAGLEVCYSTHSPPRCFSNAGGRVVLPNAVVSVARLRLAM